MFLLELAHEAIRNLGRHKLRSLLTTLGIIFGVASVLSMVALGEGAKRAILDQIKELGVRNIIINAKKPPAEENIQDEQQSRTLRYGLTFRDADQIADTLPMIEEVLPVHDIEKWLWFKSRRIAAKVRAVTPSYFDRLQLKPFLGRVLTPEDGRERRRVCVVRTKLLEEARYVGDPLKLDLKIGSEYYRVVGVLPDFEFQSPNKVVLGIDDRAMEVYVPFESALDRFGTAQVTQKAGSYESTRVELHQIVCAVQSEERVVAAARAIQAILDSFHNKKDFEVTVPLELLSNRSSARNAFSTSCCRSSRAFRCWSAASAS